jgi:hypothetical protein
MLVDTLYFHLIGRWTIIELKGINTLLELGNAYYAITPK